MTLLRGLPWSHDAGSTAGSSSARKLLADGGAGAQGGTTSDESIATVNQLSIVDTINDVRGAAKVNNLETTRLVTLAGFANAELAAETATSGRYFSRQFGRKLMQGGQRSDFGRDDLINQLSISGSSIDVRAAAFASDSAKAARLASNAALFNAQAAAFTGTDPRFFP